MRAFTDEQFDGAEDRSITIKLRGEERTFDGRTYLSDIVLQIVFYATPIIYAPAFLGTGKLHWCVVNVNPIVPFLELVRRPILAGEVPSLATYGAAALVVAVVGLLAGAACGRCQRSLVFQL